MHGVIHSAQVAALIPESVRLAFASIYKLAFDSWYEAEQRLLAANPGLAAMPVGGAAPCCHQVCMQVRKGCRTASLSVARRDVQAHVLQLKNRTFKLPDVLQPL